jgi:phospholipid/cholesterol/gamma-HCH transport system substrate-binding protein
MPESLPDRLFAMGRPKARPRPRFTIRPGRRAVAMATTALVFAAVVAGVLVHVLTSHPGRQITAYFHEAVGVYPGSDVRVLGVKVGTINSITPLGRQVKVTMTVQAGIAVPARAEAVVIVPSVVADRFIQLAPAYTGGPQMPEHGVIPASRTATPVEIDQLYASITKLAQDLGPNGVNKNGALSDVLNTGAANLAGNGRAIGTMISQFGAAMQTLSGSQGNLFGTINHLRQFTSMLKGNDSQVRRAEQQLAQVSGFLAADRQDLAGALSELATALSQVQGFIQNNRGAIKSNVSKLESITQLLVNQRASLAEALDDAPLAVDNVLGAYDPQNGTLDGRGDLNELSMGQGSSPPPYQSAAQSAPLPLPLPAVGTASPGGQ